MPKESYETILQQLVQENSPPRYCKVTMPLEKILEGAFFTEYIKRGLYHPFLHPKAKLTVPAMTRGHSDVVRGQDNN